MIQTFEIFLMQEFSSLSRGHAFQNAFCLLFVCFYRYYLKKNDDEKMLCCPIIKALLLVNQN